MNIVKLKADTEETFWAVAASVRLSQLDADSSLPSMVPGAEIIKIGEIVKTPPEADEDGNETVPATFYDGWHCDLLIDPVALPNWVDVLHQWAMLGADVKGNGSEELLELYGVTVIFGVHSPSRVMA